MAPLKLTAVAIAVLSLGPVQTSRVKPADGPVEIKHFSDWQTWRWSNSPFDSSTAVVRSTSEWVALWAPEPPRAGSHPVDFQDWMILLVAPGRVNDTHSLKITGAWLRRDTLLVSTEEFRTCASTFMEVRPFDAVAVRSTPAVVRFLWKQKVWQEVCENGQG